VRRGQREGRVSEIEDGLRRDTQPEKCSRTVQAWSEGANMGARTHSLPRYSP